MLCRASKLICRVKVDLDMKLMRSIADISHYHHYFFFQTNVLLSIENAKFGPILAIYDFFLRTYALLVYFFGVPKWTNIRYGRRQTKLCCLKSYTLVLEGIVGFYI